MEFDTSILRSADIRGVYPDQITIPFARRLGEVFGTFASKLGQEYVVVGHDNRFGGPELTKNLVEGLTSTGMNVIYIGLVTTPMLNFTSHKMGLQYGIMVTASHNPKEDNGFKLFGKDYQHCNPDELNEIYEALKNPNYEILKGKGKIEFVDSSESYANYLYEAINPGKKPIKAVIDCGNGTASVIVRKVYEKMPFESLYIYSDSDPSFPNHHPDPSVKANLKDLAKYVKYNGADIGLSYDGDCDRCGFVDNKGNIIEADRMIAIMAGDILKYSDNKTIITDIKCSNVISDVVTKLGGKIKETSASSAEQERRVFYESIPFGGQFSNHIFFLDRHPGYDDGIYVGLRAQEMLSKTNMSFNDLVKKLPAYYNTEEIKVKSTDEKKFKIVDGIKDYCETHNYKYQELDGLKIYKDNGWALLRASNTGPNLTLRFEANSESELKKIQKEFMEVLDILQK